MLEREVRILFAKEWRQLLRSPGAMGTALLLPFLMLVVVPGIQMIGVSTRPLPEHVNLPSHVTIPPNFQAMLQDPMVMMRTLLVPFIAIGALIVPSVTASYILISERETRTLELMVALPVRVGQILLAKLLALLALGTFVTLAFFGVDAVLILELKIGSPGYVLALLGVLLSGLIFSTTSALLVSLLARDFRTSNNINGWFLGSAIMVSLATVVVVPGPIPAAVLLSTLFLVASLVFVYVAMRIVTFERLLR